MKIGQNDIYACFLLEYLKILNVEKILNKIKKNIEAVGTFSLGRTGKLTSKLEFPHL